MRIIMILLFATVTSEIFSQETFSAGEISTENFNHITFSPYIYISKGDSLTIDADNDGETDFTLLPFVLDCLGDPFCPIHYFEDIEIYRSINTQFAHITLYDGCIKRYSINDTINSNQFVWEMEGISFLSLEAPEQNYCRDFIGIDSAYIGYRLLKENNDTLYGWLRIKVINNFTAIVYELGCESYNSQDTVIVSFIDDIKVKRIDNFIIPNPAHESFRIDDITEKILEIRLIDISGNLIKSFAYSQNEYYILDLKPGAYIVLIITENETLINKILKY